MTGRLHYFLQVLFSDKQSVRRCPGHDLRFEVNFPVEVNVFRGNIEEVCLRCWIVGHPQLFYSC